jgi:hypothetical protein
MQSSNNSSLEPNSPDSANQAQAIRAGVRGLPVWAKLLIGFVLGGLVFWGYFIFRFADLAHDFAVNSNNPEKMAVVANKIAKFPNPLPEGYEFDSAYSFGQDILNIRHKPDGQMITFVSGPYTQEDSKKALERTSQQALGSRAVFAPLQREKSRGEIKIAEETMPYLIGEFDAGGPKSEIVEGMIGCLSLKKQGKTIIINALPAVGSSYNLKVSEDLLQSIEGFEGTK